MEITKNKEHKDFFVVVAWFIVIFSLSYACFSYFVAPANAASCDIQIPPICAPGTAPVCICSSAFNCIYLCSHE